MLQTIRKALLLRNSCSLQSIHLKFQNVQMTTPYRTLFIQPDPNLLPTMTNQDVIDKFSKLSGSTGDYSPAGVSANLEQRKLLMDLLPKDKSELPPRRMQDSFSSVVIPMSKNKELRNRYTTVCGKVRIGRLLEDMDVFAVWVCFLHVKNPKSEGKQNPYSIVTGLVDSIHVAEEYELLTTEDIRMSGHVSWVGNTSLEASIQLDQKDQTGKFRKITDAVFVLVARDPINHGSALVNSLVAETPEEEAYLKTGEERNIQRKNAMRQSLVKMPPNEEERDIIHKIFMETINPSYAGWKSPRLPPNTRAMNSTVLNTLFMCHPQYRNRYNKVFGGFIMRQALELAYSNAFLYAKTRPKVLNIDDISFKKPVEIGGLLRFRAMVGYVEGKYIHTPVMAEVIDPATGIKDVTNVFQFTFVNESLDGGPLPLVIPHTYQEAMTYLQSRRHFNEMMEQVKRK